jgi:GNAT superfamily N-acetyltransferase
MRANEFIVEYKLSVSKDADGVAVKATAGGKPLGHAEFFFDDQGRLDPQTVWVDERYHGQGIARDMYDHLKELGYTIVRSWDQTDAGRGFWNKHRGEDARVWEQELSEISRDRLERYLDRAGRQVDTRQERMARARQRLNTSYEIYRAEEPTKIVDRFEADTPADAQRYYQDYIENYNSDVDYDLRFRKSTGLEENFADGKKPGRKGLAKRSGVNCKQSVSKLRSIAKNSSGEKQRMAHWCANMKAGKKKAK